MIKADLLFTDSEHLYKKPRIIDGNVFDDLKIRKMFDFCAGADYELIDAGDIDYAIEVLKTPVQLKKDILYRQSIIKQFRSSRNFIVKLYEILSDVRYLARIRENYDFAYGSEHDIEYLKAVNYIFFIKSYRKFLLNVINCFEGIEVEKGMGLYFFIEQIRDEYKAYDTPEVNSPIDELTAHFKDKMNIVGELRTQNNFFTTLNFDTDKNNIKSSLSEKIPFMTLIRKAEDFLDIYKEEYDAWKYEKDSGNGIYLPNKYTGFEKKFILQLIYDEETENGVDFAPMMKKIIKTHDRIDIECLKTVFDQMKFYHSVCRVTDVLDKYSPVGICFPSLTEDFAKVEVSDIIDPTLIIQKLQDYKTENNTNNLPLGKYNEIVPNSINFNEKSLYVLSGPNNGGKTSFVRAVAIALIMCGSGAPVAASRASFAAGMNVYTHFTVNETHLKESGRLQHEIQRLDEITEKCDNFAFIVLNETFAGTNSAKALQLFEDFLEKMRSIDFRAIYVTHFHNIAFAVEDKQFESGKESKQSASVGDGKQSASGGDGSIYKKCDNLIACLEPDNEKRLYKIMPAKPSDNSFSKDIVKKHNLSWEQMSERLNTGGRN